MILVRVIAGLECSSATELCRHVKLPKPLYPLHHRIHNMYIIS